MPTPSTKKQTKFLEFAVFFTVVAMCLFVTKPVHAAYRDSTTNSGNGTTNLSVAVPAGVQAGDIVILVAAINSSGADFETADWPTGFTELADVNVTLDGQSAAIGWKRLTGSDSGTYDFGDVGGGYSGDWVCQSYALSGRHATDPPVATSATNNSANSSPVSVTATGATAVAGDDILWLSAPDVNASGLGNGHSAPTNYNEKEDAENAWANLSGATREDVSAGATGNITGTFSLSSGTSGWAAFLVRIPANLSSLWNDSVTPANPDATDGQAIELGTKFTADYDGQVTGVRFYKGTNNTGTHIGNLWTTGGTNLATVTFSGESGSGWQTMNFSSPVDITAGTTYVVSYFSPTGYFAIDSGYFNSTYDNAPLHAPSSVSSGGNGVYLYTTSSAFPTNSGLASNYWVDLIYHQGAATASAALSGTITSATTESDIVSGGKNITLTLTRDTWVASGATFDAQRQNIINGIDSAQSEATGWDAQVKANQGVSGVVRTSDTVVTITLDAQSAYNITANETITATIPGTALADGTPIVAAPTFAVTAIPSNVYYSVGQNTSNHETGAGTVTVSGTTVTFSVSQTATNMGVGDVIDYDSDNKKCYISGKTSTSSWSCTNATGGTPAAATDATVNSISHAFNSLSGALPSGSGGSKTLLGSADLTALNVVLNIPCYYDSGSDTTAVTVDGWTTGENNYIKIYAPNSVQTEVNFPQRHTGKMSAGRYLLNAGSANGALDIQDDFVRIEGLQIDNTGYNYVLSIVGQSVSNNISINQIVLSSNGVPGIYVNDSDTNVEVSNSIIYGVGADYNAGILTVDLNSAYLYNNTIYDCGIGIRGNDSSAVTIKNNIVQNSSFDGYYDDFNPNSDYNISDDANDAPSPSYRTNQATIVSFLDAANRDLHLSVTDTYAKNAGVDLAGDSNLPVATDIDGQARPTGSSIVDIGADERVANVYYSVSGGGDTSTDRKVATTIGISSGVMTFSAAQTGNIGVGDEVIYGSGTKAYISGKIDTSHWTVVTALGDTSPDVSSGTALTSIKRVWSSLSAAEAGASGASYLNSSDLVSIGAALNIPCYYDTGADESYVEIDGWTTNAVSSINIYTPANTQTEANFSQRHRGVWNSTAYTIADDDGTMIYDPGTDYLRIAGLQLDSTGAQTSGICIFGAYAEVSSNIVRSSDDILWGIGTYGTNTKIYNNIVYSVNYGDIDYGIFRGRYVYNNTVYNCDVGIASEVSETIAKNNLSYENGDKYNGNFSSGANNLCGPEVDASIPGDNPQNGVTVAFADAAGFDFRLSADDAGARDYGADLSGDVDLPFSVDIEGETRPYGSEWDIGADEYVPKPLQNIYYSVGQSTTDLKTGAPTIGIVSGIATFSAPQTGNIGVGDRITYSGGHVFISGKVSQTQWNVVTVLGATPDDVASGTSVTSIKHEYTTLNGAMAGASDSSHLNSVDLTGWNYVLNIPCYYDSAADSTQVVVSGYTTGENNYIKIYTPTGASESNISQRHAGVWDTSKYRLEAQVLAYESMLNIAVDYAYVLGLQISSYPSSSDLSFDIKYYSSSGSVDNRLEVGDCILKAGGGDINNYPAIGISASDNYSRLYAYNNIFYDLRQGAYGAIFQNGWDTDIYAYNNTFQNCVLGLSLRDSGGSAFIAKNNLFKSVTTPCGGYYTVLASGSDYNSTDASSLGCTVSGGGNTHDRLSQTITFADEANDNFHLSRDDTGARGHGTDLSADSNLAFSDDIDGQTRVGTWDIGADEDGFTEETIIQSNDLGQNSMTDELLGYWSFDGPDVSGTTAYDRSGSGNDGTISGATPTMGKKGQGMSFDGSDNVVPLNNIFTDQNNVNYTISAWFKTSYSSGLQSIFSEASSSYTGDLVGINMLINSAGNISTGVYNGYDRWVNSSGSYNDNSWHHAVIVRLPDGTFNIYVDGVLDGSDNPSNSASYSLNRKAIGVKIEGSTHYYFHGALDEVRVYGSALSADQVGNLYRSGQITSQMSLTDKLTDGLVGMWSFDGPDISGNTAYDRSPVGTNHGTISGATPVIGKKGQGMGFDGSDDQVSLTTSSLGTAHTISAWFRYDGDDNGAIFSGGWMMNVLYLSDGYMCYTTGVGNLANTYDLTWENGRWYHLAVVRDGLGVTFYRDGVAEENQVDLSNNTAHDGMAYMMFGDGGGSVGYMGGILDETRIYNRALSADEVGDLYKMGQAKISR